MSRNGACRVPNILDRQFAREYSCNPLIIANLRGLYESRTGDSVNSVNEYIQKLVPFRNELAKSDKKALQGLLNRSDTAVVATVYRMLAQDFPSKADIKELVGLTYMKFTEIVNTVIAQDSGIKSWIESMRGEGKYVSRAAIIKRIGHDRIFSLLAKELESSYSNPKRAYYMNPLLEKMLKGGHLDTFLWLAKDEIAKREGIRFGKKLAFAVDFRNSETLEADFHVEESIKDGWMREIDKENPFHKVGKEVMAYLGRQIVYKSRKKVKKETGEKKRVPMTSRHGFFRLHDPQNLHKILQSRLTGCRSRKHMLEILHRMGQDDVNIMNIWDDLNNDEQLASAFYKAFHLTRCKYTKIYIDKAKNLIHSLIGNSTKFSRYFYNHSLDKAKSSKLASTIFERDGDDNIVLSKDKWDRFKSYIEEKVYGRSLDKMGINTNFDSSKEPNQEVVIARNIREIQNVLENINTLLNLGLTSKNIENLIKNKAKFKAFLYHLKKLTGANPKSGTLISRMPDIFRDRLDRMFTAVSEANNADTRFARINDSTYFTDIVSCKLANTIDYVKSLARDAEYYISLESVKEQDAGLERVVSELQNWIKDKFGVSSEYWYTDENGDTAFYNGWIQALWTIKPSDLTNTEHFFYSFDYDRAMLFDNIAAEDASAETDLKTFLVNFLSVSKSPSEGFARYPVFTTGNSLALKMIMAPKFTYDQLIENFARVARQEIARMQLASQVSERLESEGLDKGKIADEANESTEKEVTGKFVYLRMLNDYKEKLKEALRLGDDKFMETCAEILKDPENGLFKEYIEEFWNEVKDYDAFKVGTNSEGNSVFEALGGLSAIDPVSVEMNIPENGLFLYYLNTKLAYIYQYQFLGTNPSPYGLSVAMQKRFKAQNAPGTNMDIYATDYDGNFYAEADENKKPLPERVVYFRDMERSTREIDSGFMDALEDRWDGNHPALAQYAKDTDVTNGQGFRSLVSYRRVMGMSHQWTEEQEAFYKRLQEIREAAWERAAKKLGVNLNTIEGKRQAMLNATLTAEEIDELDSFNVVLQPIKPHTATVEKVHIENGNPNSDALLIPVEHKYAEAVIIPELFSVGSLRRSLGVEMEVNKIDMACGESCVKVGSFGAADLRSSTSDTFSEDFSKGYVHEISYEDYTIQTAVPEHINTMQLVGTQIRKHVFDALNLMASYNLGGISGVNINGIMRSFEGERGGANFLKFYNALTCANMGHDLRDLSNKISKIETLSDILTELKSNDYGCTIEDVMKYGLDEEGNFAHPISDPSGSYDVESILTSIFKREVNKQRISGGSCVQVSDYGIEGFGSDLKVHTETAPDGKTNITYIDCAMAFDFTWKDAAGNEIKLKFSDYCNPDGTLIMLEDGTSKIERDFPGILDLVAYRIPTERVYSIFNLKVKRFFPKMMGGTIMLPSQYIKVAGFDFDIDKLYYFRKEFRQANKFSKQEVLDIWNEIYGLRANEDGTVDKSSTTDVYRALDEARKRAVKRYKEAIRIEDIEDENARMDALLQISTGMSELLDFDPSKKDLHEFWENAGLTETTGMTATEYFAKFVRENGYIEFEEYDPEKDVYKNTVTARNNMLIECIKSRLTDPATFDARYVPGGFENAKRDANILKALMYTDRFSTYEEAEKFVDSATDEELAALDVNLDVTNVLTTCEYNARNRVAAKVIGIMANHNTNAVFSKAMERLVLRTPVRMFGESFTDLNSTEKTTDKRDYMHTLAELLASSVDAVKEPVLNFLNINSYTANTAALLARLGLSTAQIGLFLNQPIIKEVCMEAANSGDSSITSAINRVASRYKMKLSDKEPYREGPLTTADLSRTLKSKIQTEDRIQQNILSAFKAISAQAQALSDFIAKTKYTASNSIENSLGSMLELIYDNKAANERETLINKHLSMRFGQFDELAEKEKDEDLNSPIKSDESITLEDMGKKEYRRFLDASPFAFEQMVHDAVMAYMKKVCKYFPYNTPKYKAVYDMMFCNTVFGKLDADIIDRVNRQLPLYILSSRPDSPFNPDLTEGDNKNRIYFVSTFPEQLESFLQEREDLKGLPKKSERAAEYKKLQERYLFLQNVPLDAILDNELLDRMLVSPATSGKDGIELETNDVWEGRFTKFDITLEENAHFDKDIKDALIAAWDDLVGDKNEKVRDPRTSLAHSLFMYNYFSRGYEVGMNAFSNITPLSVTETLMVNSYMSYANFYEGLNDGSITSYNIDMFYPLFLANNVDNSKLVKQIYGISLRDGAEINRDGLPEGRVEEVEGVTQIIFEGGPKQNYERLTLPASKRAVSEEGTDRKSNTRALIGGFKVKDSSGNIRLFVLMPSTNAGAFRFSDPEYNVRPLSSNVRYVEVPIKGIKGHVADYSRGMLKQDSNNDMHEYYNDQSNINNSKYNPYVSEPPLDLDAEREASIAETQQRAESLIEKAKKNKKENNWC